MKILTAYFTRHQHVAYAVAAAGTDLAAVSFPFIGQVIYNQLPYMYGTLSTAAVLLPLIPCALLFAEKRDGEKAIEGSAGSADPDNDSVS